MFETPLIERFSRIHPATPFVFYIPILAYLLVSASLASGVGLAAQAALIAGGILFWTLVEYVLHRYLFHYMGPKHWQRRLYFIIHGVHHDYPQDVDRLVMPLGASIPLAVVFYFVFHALLGDALADFAFAGFGIGYLAYDGIHFATHHWKMSSRVGKWLKRHHMVHHHTGEQARWGVSSPLWDWVFGTLESPSERVSRAAAPASK